MPVITLNTEVSFDIAEIDDADIDREFRRRDKLLDKLSGEIENNIEPASPYDFETSDLIEVLNSRNVELFDWAAKVYALIAAGDVDEAMEIMNRECEGLAPPSHARRLANLLKVRGIHPHVQN